MRDCPALIGSRAERLTFTHVGHFQSMLRLTAVAAVGLSISGVSGCETRAGNVAIAARDYVAALSRGDGSAACAQLTLPAREGIERRAHRACPQAVLAGEPPRLYLRRMTVSSESVSADTGSVSLVSRGPDNLRYFTVPVSLVNGEWRMGGPLRPVR